MTEFQGMGGSRVAKASGVFEDIGVNTRVKLSGLWVSLTLCFIYCDYIGLYKPGWLQTMLEGRMGPLGEVTEGVLLGVSVLMVIPCLMVFLSLVLKPGLNRWVNIAVALMFVLITIVSVIGEWVYYIFFGIIELVLISFVIRYAWTWPRRQAA